MGRAQAVSTYTFVYGMTGLSDYWTGKSVGRHPPNLASTEKKADQRALRDFL